MRTRYHAHRYTCMFGAGYFGGGREASDLDEAVFDHGGESMYSSGSPDGSQTSTSPDGSPPLSVRAYLSDDVSAASGSPFADDTFSVSDSPFAMDSPEHDGIDGGDDGLSFEVKTGSAVADYIFLYAVVLFMVSFGCWLFDCITR